MKINITNKIDYAVEVYSSPIDCFSLNISVKSLLEGHTWLFGVFQKSGQLTTEIRSFGVNISPMLAAALSMAHSLKKFKHGFTGVLTMNYIEGGTGFGVWSEESINRELEVRAKLKKRVSGKDQSADDAAAEVLDL